MFMMTMMIKKRGGERS
uniref:Uncharacterized protein n=1 Tax=Rhizophora mucronata TaxID=61149 RepID=A0A2P2MCN6_RHIMU